MPTQLDTLSGSIWEQMQSSSKELKETPHQLEVGLFSEKQDYSRLPRYTLPDFKGTRWSRFMQKIVDYLHSKGD